MLDPKIPPEKILPGELEDEDNFDEDEYPRS